MKNGAIRPWSLQMNQASKVYVIIHSAITWIQLTVKLYCYTRLIKGLYIKEIENPAKERETTVEKKDIHYHICLGSYRGFLLLIRQLNFYTYLGQQGMINK